jgi:hypothetical protein
MYAKISICLDCAAKLRDVRDAQGEEAMAAAMGEILCEGCLSRVPGYEPGRRLEVVLKKTPPIPIGHA